MQSALPDSDMKFPKKMKAVGTTFSAVEKSCSSLRRTSVLSSQTSERMTSMTSLLFSSIFFKTSLSSEYFGPPKRLTCPKMALESLELSGGGNPMFLTLKMPSICSPSTSTKLFSVK